MSIRTSLKWMALAGLGFLISGCVAAPTAYSPSNAGYSQAAPGTFVADPNYAGGGYYEVVEAYDEPSYYYGPPVPRYYGPTGIFGTSLYYHHSHGSHRHRHKHGDHAHADHPKPKGKRPKRRAKKKDGKKADGKRVLTDEQIAAREERRARHQACRDAGHKNCKAQRKAERRAAKEEAELAEAAPKKKRKIRPANKRKRLKN